MFLEMCAVKLNSSSENTPVKLSQDVLSVCCRRKRLLVRQRHEVSSVNHFDKWRVQENNDSILETLAKAMRGLVCQQKKAVG